MESGVEGAVVVLGDLAVVNEPPGQRAHLGVTAKRLQADSGLNCPRLTRPPTTPLCCRLRLGESSKIVPTLTLNCFLQPLQRQMLRDSMKCTLRGASCLILGWDGAKPVHVVVGYASNPVTLVTAYHPEPDAEWRDERRRQ